jgi:hypothetical protein
LITAKLEQIIAKDSIELLQRLYEHRGELCTYHREAMTIAPDFEVMQKIKLD